MLAIEDIIVRRSAKAILLKITIRVVEIETIEQAFIRT